MDFASSIHSVLALNIGNYFRQLNSLPQAKGFIYATTNFEIGTTDVLHYHDTSHLSFILKGGMVDKRQSYEIERSAGDLMFFYEGEPHQSIYKLFPITNITIELNTSFLQQNSINESDLRDSVTNNPLTKFIMLKIFKELLINDVFSDCSVELLLLDLISERKRSTCQTHPKWIGIILELLNDQWNEPLMLKDLAKAADIHPTTISTHLPKYISCTLGEYRRRLRTERALQLIKNSNLSLTEIAHQCGFSDQSHFTRTFKHLTGFLPRYYRSL